MKKLMNSMLAIAAMASMISCSTEDILDEGGQIDNGPVEIKLNAGVSATTKAAITDQFTEDFTALFFRPADAATADWTSGTTIKATVSGAGDHAITFLGENDAPAKQFYNEDATKKSHLAACHIGSLTRTGEPNTGMSFTITGQEDIMATDAMIGDKTTKFNSFQFKHLLTQIDIVLKGDAAAQAAFGKIKSVKIKDVPTQLKLTLGNTPSIEEVAAASKGEISVYSSQNGESLSTNTANTPIASSVMIYNGGTTAPYGTEANPLTLEVTSESGGTNGVSTVTIKDVTGGLAQSQKHIITLNFKEKISATATVAVWDAGNAGTGSVE